jgi:hypothetical protein
MPTTNNPFDDDWVSPEKAKEEDDPREDIFPDSYQDPGIPAAISSREPNKPAGTKKRSAPLNFNMNYEQEAAGK